MYELIVESEFSAAHRLREYRGACEKLHGHNYRVEMVVASEKLDALGMVADFRELKRLLQEAAERYDHAFLNELAEFREAEPDGRERGARAVRGMLAADAARRPRAEHHGLGIAPMRSAVLGAGRRFSFTTTGTKSTT